VVVCGRGGGAVAGAVGKAAVAFQRRRLGVGVGFDVQAGGEGGCG
jgi:hypothetical protein